MTGICPHCGSIWSTDPDNLSFRACCDAMEDELRGECEEEADRRAEIAWERINGWEA